MVEARAFREAVIREAADWLARLDADPADASLRAAFAAWRREDPSHVVALARLGHAWEAAGAAASTGEAAPSPASKRSQAGARRRAALVGAAAAAAAGLALLIGFAQPGVSYATGVGEHRRVELPGGVVLELNTATRVRVVGRGAGRALRLERGEMLVTRAPDAEPLRVMAGDADLASPSGVFDVRLRGRGAELAVLDGAVNVGAAQARAGDYATLTGDPAGVRVERSGEEVRRRLAWRRGLLDFDGQTLAEAAEEFNRYNDVRISVDRTAAAVRVGGVFSAREPRAFAGAAARAFGLSEIDGGSDLRLSATPR